MDIRNKGFFFELLFPKVIFQKGIDWISDKVQMKLRTYGKETYCDQDLQSFIDDLKSECNCNDGSCLFDQLLQIDGLIISNCKCGKGIINQLSQPIAVNLDSLRKQSALALQIRAFILILRAIPKRLTSPHIPNQRHIQL